MNSQLFSLRRHERPVFLFALLLAVVLQAIIIYRYNHIFTDPGPSYWAVFLHHFSVSGYDPITYSVVTDWTAKYNVFRHPLLAFFMAPLYWLNLGLTALTGVNCVQYVVAFFWIVATVLCLPLLLPHRAATSRRQWFKVKVKVLCLHRRGFGANSTHCAKAPS